MKCYEGTVSHSLLWVTQLSHSRPRSNYFSVAMGRVSVSWTLGFENKSFGGSAVRIRPPVFCDRYYGGRYESSEVSVERQYIWESWAYHRPLLCRHYKPFLDVLMSLDDPWMAILASTIFTLIIQSVTICSCFGGERI